MDVNNLLISHQDRMKKYSTTKSANIAKSRELIQKKNRNTLNSHKKNIIKLVMFAIMNKKINGI